MGDGMPICRACLKSTMECVDLEAPLEDNDNITYRDGFNMSTQLNALEDDELPKNLCCSCADELKGVFLFIRKARASDQVLRNKVNITTIQKSGSLVDDKMYEVKEEVDTESKQEFVVLEIEENYAEQKGRDELGTDTDNIESDDQNKIEQQDADIDESERNETLSSNRTKKRLLCNICGKTCSQKSTLESHLLKHKGERPYKCNKCDKSYYTKNGLQMHKTAHSEKGQERKFVCEVCSKAFATAQRLRIHNLTHTGEKDYECTLCPKRFATQFRLRNHLRIHTGERPYECSVCGLKFAQNNALNCHMRIHTGEKPYECKICGKRFNQNTILKTHMTLHTGKTVQCPNCDKKFSRPSYLILHQREHTGEKPYACHKCPNRYKQKSHLDRHLDTHFGVKHTCTECGKEYSKKSSLKIHMFTHVDQKPFHCESCSMSFTRRDKYRNHLKKVHDKDLVNNEVTDIIACERFSSEPGGIMYISDILVNSSNGDVHTVLVRNSTNNNETNVETGRMLLA